MEVYVRKQSEQLLAEASIRRSLEKDLAWILQEGVIHMMDRVNESEEFSLGVWCLKAACVAAVIEGGKQAVRK